MASLLSPREQGIHFMNYKTPLILNINHRLDQMEINVEGANGYFPAFPLSIKCWGLIVTWENRA